MARRFLLFFLWLCSVAAVAQSHFNDREMRVGLYRERPTKQVMVMSARGVCTVLADGVRKGELRSDDGLRLEQVGNAIAAKSLTLSFSAKKVEVVPSGGGFRMRALDRKEAERSYPGALEASVADGRMLLVDRVGLEAYTAGVVSAEAGKEHHIEYYKLQSVSCRTYALTNMRKHIAEGFEVCDGVHCQVFRGRNRNDSIQQATDATHGLVIVDPDIKLIHATFHSNCGGETLNAEDLWSKHEPYLRATRDTFCLRAPHATWEKSMPRTEWLGYLQQRFGYKAENEARLNAVLHYEPQCRDLYLGNTWPLLPLKHVREDLKLKSTYFSVRTEGDRVLLKGRGFGHAVGLCQEGAMGMARAGFSYTDILHHYYTDVHLVDLGTLDFFRDEELQRGMGGGPKQR
jgi:stage II sporulation protein D